MHRRMQKIIFFFNLGRRQKGTNPSLAARTQGILYRGEGNQAQPLCSLHGRKPLKDKGHLYKQGTPLKGKTFLEATPRGFLAYHRPKVLQCASQRPLRYNKVVGLIRILVRFGVVLMYDIGTCVCPSTKTAFM